MPPQPPCLPPACSSQEASLLSQVPADGTVPCELLSQTGTCNTPDYVCTTPSQWNKDSHNSSQTSCEHGRYGCLGGAGLLCGAQWHAPKLRGGRGGRMARAFPQTTANSCIETRGVVGCGRSHPRPAGPYPVPMQRSYSPPPPGKRLHSPANAFAALHTPLQRCTRLHGPCARPRQRRPFT